MSWKDGIWYPDAKLRFREDRHRLAETEEVLEATLAAVRALRAHTDDTARALDIAPEWICAHARRALGSLLPEQAIQLPTSRLVEMERQLGRNLRNEHCRPGSTFPVPWE